VQHRRFGGRNAERDAARHYRPGPRAVAALPSLRPAARHDEISSTDRAVTSREHVRADALRGDASKSNCL
jgi:hypothetical protein